jgi:hypothetical protein
MHYLLTEAHRYYRPSKGPRLPSVAVGQQRISGYIGMDHSLPIQEVTLEQAIIEFVVDTQSPFDIVENKKFQQMMRIAMKGELCPVRSARVLRERITSNFLNCKVITTSDLETTCAAISLSLDAWTSKNHKAIFGVIGHWVTEDFEYQEAVLDFGHLKGKHSGENLTSHIYLLLNSYRIKQKLFAISGDNASNNSTLYRHLYRKLKREFNDEVIPNSTKPMDAIPRQKLLHSMPCSYHQPHLQGDETQHLYVVSPMNLQLFIESAELSLSQWRSFGRWFATVEEL